MRKNLFFLFYLLIFISSCSAASSDSVNNGIESDQLINAINKGKPLLIKDRIITDDLDFTRIKNHEVFSSSLETAYIDLPVTFLNCIFMGKVTANGMEAGRQVRVHFGRTLSFEACDFRQEVNFDNIIVDGEVNFTGAIFRQQARFNNITLNGRNNWFTAFSSAKYFSMQEAMIHGSVDFFKGVVNGKISFQSTEIQGIARFSDLECFGNCDFSLVRFRNDALFTYANFSGDFRMANALVYGRFDLNSCEFQANVYLSNTCFYGPANFSKSSAKGVFDLEEVCFYSDAPDFSEFSTEQSGQLNTKGARIVYFNDLVPFEINQPSATH
jgi:hypothetical protein